MPFTIKNWKLALLSIIGIGFFCSLGTWQLSRARYKEALVASFTARLKAPALNATHLLNPSLDLRFYQIALTGQFDNAHTLLLDNKTFHGRVGYQIYTPFQARGLPFSILVDRGFIPRGKQRNEIPAITPILGETSIKGLLNFPPAYFALGAALESPHLTWPLRIQYLDLKELKEVLPYTLSSYIITLAQESSPYAIEWKAVPTDPARHRGYALQWFALALTLLILFVALNWNRKHP